MVQPWGTWWHGPQKRNFNEIMFKPHCLWLFVAMFLHFFGWRPILSCTIPIFRWVKDLLNEGPSRMQWKGVSRKQNMTKTANAPSVSVWKNGTPDRHSPFQSDSHRVSSHQKSFQLVMLTRRKRSSLSIPYGVWASDAKTGKLLRSAKKSDAWSLESCIVNVALSENKAQFLAPQNPMVYDNVPPLILN